MIITPKISSQEYLNKLSLYIKDFRDDNNFLFEEILDLRKSLDESERKRSRDIKILLGLLIFLSCGILIWLNCYKRYIYLPFLVLGVYLLSELLGMSVVKSWKKRSEYLANDLLSKHKAFVINVGEAGLFGYFGNLCMGNSSYIFRSDKEVSIEDIKEYWNDPCLEDGIYRALCSLEEIIKSNSTLKCAEYRSESHDAVFERCINGYKVEPVIIYCPDESDFNTLTIKGNEDVWDFSYLEDYMPFNRKESA